LAKPELSRDLSCSIFYISSALNILGNWFICLFASEQWEEVSIIYGISSVGGLQQLASRYCLLSPLNLTASVSIAYAKNSHMSELKISEANISISVLVLSKANLWIKQQRLLHLLQNQSTMFSSFLI